MSTEYGLAASIGESEAASSKDAYGSGGWTSAAIAVHSILQIPVPMFLRLELVGYPPFLVDFPRHMFDWELPMASFPAYPLRVVIETEPVFPGAAALFTRPGKSLDTLIWALGINAFSGGPAPWLVDGDRYRLLRWPNFTDWVTTPDQVRMTAVLGNIALTVDELATAADVDPLDARKLINAFSLMGIVSVEAGDPSGYGAAYGAAFGSASAAPELEKEPVFPAPADDAPVTRQAASLFRRLRDKLGW